MSGVLGGAVTPWAWIGLIVLVLLVIWLAAHFGHA
jgi:hypothetical protein